MIDFKGLPAVRIVAPGGAEATVLLQGAQVLSWKPAGGQERLYLSDRAIFKPGEPVRGGVPICFPQFSRRGPLPQHGFARNLPWECITERTGEDYAMTVLRLVDDETTREAWPHAFQCELTVSITGQRLDMELEVLNTDDEAFSFTAALHTYLGVREVEEASLEGLRGLRYFDNVLKQEDCTETGTELVVDRELDRIYFDLQRPLLLREPRRALGINAENFADAVVWNPWETRTPSIADLPPDGFRRYLCVEAGAIGQAVTLTPEQSWWGRQTLVAL